MSRLPYIPLYVGDFLASTTMMSGEARMVYLMLLVVAWEHDASLPNDDAALARAAGASTKLWRRVRDEVLAKFTIGADGRLRQARLTEVFKELARGRTTA